MMKITTARLLGLFAVVALAGIAFSGSAVAADECGDWCVTPETNDLDQQVLQDNDCGDWCVTPETQDIDQSVVEDHKCGASYCTDPDLDGQFFEPQYVSLVA